MSSTRKTPPETLSLIARIALLALVAGGLTAAAAVAGADRAGQDPDGERRVIRIEKKQVDCEGEGCAEAAAVHKVIFVGEDGEVHELSGEGAHWVGEGAPHVIHLGRLGEGRAHVVQLGEGFGGKAGYLGVMLTPMTPELRSHQGVPEEAGVLVSKVMDDSPAGRAGVLVGDVISAVDGEAVATPRDLAHAIRGRKDGDAVTLELWRGGTVQNLTTAVEERQGLGPVARRIELRCEGDKCKGVEGAFEPYDCGGAEECEVMVHCTGGGECDCTANGERVDCLTIPGPYNR